MEGTIVPPAFGPEDAYDIILNGLEDAGYKLGRDPSDKTKGSTTCSDLSVSIALTWTAYPEGTIQRGQTRGGAVHLNMQGLRIGVEVALKFRRLKAKTVRDVAAATYAAQQAIMAYWATHKKQPSYTLKFLSGRTQKQGTDWDEGILAFEFVGMSPME